MSKEKQRDDIWVAADQFATAIKSLVGADTRVGVFYCYLDAETHEWVSGDAGNANRLERIGMLTFLRDLAEKDN